MMVLGKEKVMNVDKLSKEVMALIVGTVLVGVTAIICATYYNVKKDESIRSSIESAIVKGIDPMSVRCAYGATDVVCIAYAARK